MDKSYYIGLMSGTSLDSVDAVLVSFTPEFSLHATHTHPLPEALRSSSCSSRSPSR
ncbi:MAG: anhydro-N-acetylmuramic acid kinase, partial [Marinobacterium sp.]